MMDAIKMLYKKKYNNNNLGFCIIDKKGKLIAYYDLKEKEAILYKGYKKIDIISYDDLMVFMEGDNNFGD